MDPNIRWIRRLVAGRVLERLAIEATAAGVVVGAIVQLAGASVFEVGSAAVSAAVAVAAVRPGLALSTNPVGHRYLMHWNDPSDGLVVDCETEPTDSDLAAELAASGFRFRARLGAGLDVYQAEWGRLVVATSDDGEFTVVSRLDDGRVLVTSHGFVPPVEALVVNRISPAGAAGPEAGAGEAVVSHVERLLELRQGGVEAIATDRSAMQALMAIEWEGWQQLGPFLGPFVAVEPRGGRLRLQVRVPDAPAIRGVRSRSRLASG